MATMWFARDGKRPHSQHGPGMEITRQDLDAIVGRHEARYMGPEAPSINPDKVSSTVKHVVLEIDAQDSNHPGFPVAGFYWVVALDPSEATRRLDAHRRSE